MQSTDNTLAESLLQRLLLSKKLDELYHCTIERTESHTSIFIRMVTSESGLRTPPFKKQTLVG